MTYPIFNGHIPDFDAKVIILLGTLQLFKSVSTTSMSHNPFLAALTIIVCSAAPALFFKSQN